MERSQVVSNFVILKDGDIECQCGFQVMPQPMSSTFPCKNGGSLQFTHHYTNDHSEFSITYAEQDHSLWTVELNVPINRTKHRWKKRNLGEGFEAYYRCRRTVWDDQQPTKQEKKRRRKSLERLDSDDESSHSTIFYKYTDEKSADA